jgi:5-amino-6-(5-phosphoribosylamino)uracil reductase
MPDRPYTMLSCSVSLDGYLGDRTPRLALSNAADFERVDEVRASCDAIMVGAATVRIDNPRLLVRSQARRAEREARGLASSPMKITVTGRADLDAESNFFTTGEAAKLVYTSSPRVPDARARLGPVATIVDGGLRVRMRWLSEDLADRGVSSRRSSSATRVPRAS